MRERLEGKGASRDRIVVIPNWIDTTDLLPRPRDNQWAREHGLIDSFVVMHSGNIGHAQDLDTLIRSATFLRDVTDLRIVLIGGGARRDELKQLARVLEIDHLLFMGYQARELLADSLSAADVHVVGLARGLSGYVVPSRLYGILAVGRPVIAAAEADSETAKVVDEVGCGVVVPPGRPELLARAIRRAHDGELDLEEMGRRGREYVASVGDRSVAVERYRDVLRELVNGERARDVAADRGDRRGRGRGRAGRRARRRVGALASLGPRERRHRERPRGGRSARLALAEGLSAAVALPVPRLHARPRRVRAGALRRPRRPRRRGDRQAFRGARVLVAARGSEPSGRARRPCRGRAPDREDVPRLRGDLRAQPGES